MKLRWPDWLRRKSHPFAAIMDDGEAIAHDWQVVGDDLRRAMGQRITDEINDETGPTAPALRWSTVGPER